MTTRENYGSLDGLRAMAAIGIIMMHIRANSHYEISGAFYNIIVASFDNFVFLFMVISAFGMCCGYYDKILNNQISFAEFYFKRYRKVMPFFAILVVLDIIISPSLSSVYEGFADITLFLGFLPDAGNISVIGVGWFLGLVFVFYLLFPFYCVLIQNKRRAWFSFAISLIYNYVGFTYFNIDRRNILYSACYFILGGLIYLYRDSLIALGKKHKAICFVFLILVIYFYYSAGHNTVTMLLVCFFLMLYAISGIGLGGLDNKYTKFFSGISLEIYLSHMVIFRIIEKLGMNEIIDNDVLQYVFTVLCVIVGAGAFSIIVKSFLEIAKTKIS